MNFARLNHILIPTTKAGRDRLRNSRLGRGFKVFGDIYLSFTREGRVVLFVCFIAGLFGLEVRARQSYLAWCVLTGLILSSFLIRRAFRLNDVSIDVEVSRLVSVGEEVPFHVILRNQGEQEHQALTINGPLLPWDGQFTSERATVQSLKPESKKHVVIRARFAARGEHHLDPFTVTALVPFGLVTCPLLGSRGVRFLVVPKIAPVTHLRTPLVHKYQPGGVALASQTGESMELMGLRPYRLGDPIRDLHAKRWARLGTPVVREYQQEYFTRVGVVVDTDYRLADEDRFESGLSLAAGVVAYLSRGEALIDLLVVGQEIHQLTLGRSLGFLDQALELLACVEQGPGFDPNALQSRLAPHLAQISCIVFVSLGWDAARRLFVDSVLRRGVGCRVLHVTSSTDLDLGADRGGDITEVSISAIRNTQGLAL